MVLVIVLILALIMAYSWWLRNKDKIRSEGFYPGFDVDKGNSYYDPVSGQRVFPKN